MTVLLLVRLSLVVTNAWNTEFGGDLPESLISGRAAFDLLNGSWRGWQTYAYAPGGNLGNEIAASLLVLPMFRIWGPSLLVMAIVPALSAIVTGLLTFRLSRSRSAALVSTLYFVCMPIAVQSWGIYPYFAHVEAGTWFLLALWILEPVLQARAAGVRRLFMAGLVIGGGIVLCDLTAAAVPALVAAYWVSNAPRRAACAAWAGAGLVVGLLPYELFVLARPAAIPGFYAAIAARGGAPLDLDAYLVPLAMPVSMLWPISAIADGVWLRGVVAGAAFAALIFRARRAAARPVDPIAVAVTGFILTLWSAVVVVRTTSESEYYVYALAAPIAMLIGDVLAEVSERWPARIRSVAFGGLVATALVIAAASVLPVQRRSFEDGWRRDLTAHGYQFYWPDPYPVFSGYKTPLGREVEAAASHTRFVAGATPQRGDKVIALNAVLRASHPLQTRDDYLIYGADVTDAGVEVLCARAAKEIEPLYQPEAFGSIAVFAANDLLLGDLLALFEEGAIDRAVPACCVQPFYSELGRKIRDRRAAEQPRVTALLDRLSAERRAWVESGMTESEYVDYRVATWPRRN